MGHRPSLLSRLTASTQHLDAAELQSEVEQLRTCTMMDKICRGEAVTVGGRIRSVVYTPRENVPTLEAELFDGTSSIKLVWLGRRRIAGIEPGRRLIARGRVGDHEGAPAIYNPWYELQATSTS
ncbi:MAG TPA: OB-fold nucleic acid binding domain-containing protein [Jatrophihabitans sp.]|jgi:RecG-like helicase